MLAASPLKPEPVRPVGRPPRPATPLTTARAMGAETGVRAAFAVVPAESPARVAAMAVMPSATEVAVSLPPHSGVEMEADAAPPIDIPVYATRLAASTTLHYALQRGAVAGTAELQWRHAPEGYELDLQASIQGVQVLGSTSRGAIDADGVAPLRYVERKRLREVRAANFQRDRGQISFSGPDQRYRLIPGAQDRLSWMLQLPAIVEAEPALRATGSRVTLFVVGTRGDAQAWEFLVQGRESLQLPAGAVDGAVKLLREPTRPFDTRAEVWLDPSRQHLPVRVVLTTVPGGQPLVWQLAQATAP